MNSDIIVYAMDISVQFQKKAIELRREGNSYTDIAKHLRVSRSAVCGWVKNVRLTEAEKHLLETKLQTKRDKGKLHRSVTLRAQKVYKEKVAYEDAEKEFAKLSKDPFFMLGMGLWGIEKPKKNRTSFTFTTSVPENMAIIQKWLHKYLGIPSKSLKIRVLKIKSGESSSFTLSKIGPVRRIIAWQKLTMLYYS
jgi:predicted transcriptional regulator